MTERIGDNDMTNSPEDSLALAREMENKSQLKAIPPRWFNYVVSITIGSLFVLVIEFGRLGLAVLPIPLFLVAIHYRKAGVWPYFFKSSSEVLNEIKDEFTSKLAINVFLIIGMIASPFLLIKTIELKTLGYTYAPYAGGLIVSLFVLITAEISRNYFLKKYCNQSYE